MQRFIKIAVLLLVGVLAHDPTETSIPENTSLISDDLVEKVQTALATEGNELLGEVLHEHIEAENSENTENSVTDDVLLSDYSAEILNPESEVVGSEDTESESIESDSSESDGTESPPIETHEEDSSLQGGEALVLDVALEDTNVLDNKIGEIKSKIQDKLDFVETKIEVDEQRLANDKKQQEFLENIQEKMGGEEEPQTGDDEENVDPNESFTLKPEVKEKIVTELVERWVEKNMIHCNDHEGVNCIQTSDAMNSNGNTTTEIVILVVIIIVVLLLLGGCIYFIKMTTPSGETSFDDPESQKPEVGREINDSHQTSQVMIQPDQQSSSDEPLLANYDLTGAVEPISANIRTPSTSDASHENKFDPKPFTDRTPDDEIKKSLRRLDTAGLPTLTEEMDAMVTLGREKRDSRPPVVHPNKILTDEEMKRNSNVSLSTIGPGDPKFGSI